MILFSHSAVILWVSYWSSCVSCVCLFTVVLGLTVAALCFFVICVPPCGVVWCLCDCVVALCGTIASLCRWSFLTVAFPALFTAAESTWNISFIVFFTYEEELTLTVRRVLSAHRHTNKNLCVPGLCFCRYLYSKWLCGSFLCLCGLIVCLCGFVSVYSCSVSVLCVFTLRPLSAAPGGTPTLHDWCFCQKDFFPQLMTLVKNETWAAQ